MHPWSRSPSTPEFHLSDQSRTSTNPPDQSEMSVNSRAAATIPSTAWVQPVHYTDLSLSIIQVLLDTGPLSYCCWVHLRAVSLQLFSGNFISWVQSLQQPTCQLGICAATDNIRHQVGGVGSVVERRSSAGELSLSCAWPAANGWPLTWVSRPLQVNQLGQLSLSSFRGR